MPDRTGNPVLPPTVTTDLQHTPLTIAVLPVGSWEQHGPHLPLATDTLVAVAISNAVAAVHQVWQLPPITLSCSHEHAGFPGTVSISSATLSAVVGDVARSLELQGIRRLVLINGHGGNYALSNVVQEANVSERRMALFPTREDWAAARLGSGMTSAVHEDMHAGELETSVLLATAPDLVRPGYEDADHTAPSRGHLLTLGIGAYTRSGIIGFPSLASANKGDVALDLLATAFSLTMDTFGPEA
jgi:creatinine amidohydrolase